MRGLRTDRTAGVIIAGHAFMRNLRRGHDELGLDVAPALRVAAAFTNLPVVTIDDLVRLVPPPAAPVDADGDWSAVEAALGLRLPADFQALVGRYGVGQFGDISLWTPFAKRLDGVFDLVKHARRLVDFHRPLRDELPEDFPHPLYPEPGGLLEWASTSNGDSRCWLTGGDPDSWPAVVWNIRRGAYTVMSNTHSRAIASRPRRLLQSVSNTLSPCRR